MNAKSFDSIHNFLKICPVFLNYNGNTLTYTLRSLVKRDVVADDDKMRTNVVLINLPESFIYQITKNFANIR